MNFYIKCILGLGLSGLSLLASQDRSSEIKTLEAQALQKLTAQLRTKTPANINPELSRLHEIAVKQAEDKAESLQNKINIFGAAAIGALCAKATERSSQLPPIHHVSYQPATTGNIEATKMITGLEATAMAAFLPSGTSLLFGALGIGALFAMYKINNAIHAPCRTKFEFAEHQFNSKLESMKSDTEAKQAELRHTLATLKTENEGLKEAWCKVHKDVQGVKTNQAQIQSEIKTAGAALSGVQTTLSSMSKEAHWDLSRFPKEAARAGLQEQQEALKREQELQKMIHEAGLGLLVAELEDRKKGKGAGASVFSTGPQRSTRQKPQALHSQAPDIGAGVFPPKKFVKEVGCFGCLGSSLPTKHPELR